MKKITSVYPEKLVLRVNELYHDFTSEQYQHSHPEIFEHEKERWERIAKQFLNLSRSTTIADIGTGTGFVPLQLAKFLRKEDTFICSDISKGILEVARQIIKKQNFQCKFKFVKIENQVPYRLPFETRSIDIVTMNSVLHHVRNTDAFLDEIDRILKPNGLLIIGHEPNNYFYATKLLWYIYFLFDHLPNPKLVVDKLLRRSSTEKSFETSKEIVNKLNNILLREKLAKKPLSAKEVEKIVDIKSREGFTPDLLLPNYDLLHFETYNHMSRISVRHHNNLFIRKYDRLLRRVYPRSGATFFIVLKRGL